MLSESAVNLPALRMAVNLAHKRLAGDIATAKSMTAASLAAAEEPASAAPPAAPTHNGETVAANVMEMNGARPPESKPPRYYRGYLVED